MPFRFIMNYLWSRIPVMRSCGHEAVKRHRTGLPALAPLQARVSRRRRPICIQVQSIIDTLYISYIP
jgi:hypothetical protein